MTTCPTCGKESDRLATLLEMRLHEVNVALGLDRYATQEQRLAAIKQYSDAFIVQEIRAGRVMPLVYNASPQSPPTTP